MGNCRSIVEHRDRNDILIEYFETYANTPRLTIVLSGRNRVTADVTALCPGFVIMFTDFSIEPTALSTGPGPLLFRTRDLAAEWLAETFGRPFHHLELSTGWDRHDFYRIYTSREAFEIGERSWGAVVDHLANFTKKWKKQEKIIGKTIGN
jgi:hypothetical protein